MPCQPAPNGGIDPSASQHMTTSTSPARRLVRYIWRRSSRAPRPCCKVFRCQFIYTALFAVGALNNRAINGLPLCNEAPIRGRGKGVLSERRHCLSGPTGGHPESESCLSSTQYSIAMLLMLAPVPLRALSWMLLLPPTNASTASARH